MIELLINRLINKYNLPWLDPGQIEEISYPASKQVSDWNNLASIYASTAYYANTLSITRPHLNKLAYRLLEASHLEQIKLAGLSMANLFLDSAKFFNLAPDYQAKIAELGAKVQEIINRTQLDISYTGYQFMLDTYCWHSSDRASQSWLPELVSRKPTGRKPTGQCALETPINLFARVALDLSCSLSEFEVLFAELASMRIMLGSPMLFNCGKPGKLHQLSSCFLLGFDDNIESINDTFHAAGLIGSRAGGLGSYLHNIRAAGEPLSSGGYACGIMPIIRTLDALCQVNTQGGLRPGNHAIYLELWHPEILEFISIRDPHGNAPVKNVFPGIWLNDLFMRCVKHDLPWYLLKNASCLADLHDKMFTTEDIREHPDLSFTTLYYKLATGDRICQSLPARDLFAKIVRMMLISGTPYMLAKDQINRTSMHKHLGPIRGSNLCTEIVEYHDSVEHAVCNIGSLNLARMVQPDIGSLDFGQLGDSTRILVDTLNRVIDNTWYPTTGAMQSNINNRPIAIGIQGLADVFTKIGYAFDSDLAVDLSKQISECIYFESMMASSVYGDTYWPETFHPDSQAGSDRAMQCALDSKYEWDLVMDGARANSMLTAYMPTSNTSIITGSTPCFEPMLGLISKRINQFGSYVSVNQDLLAALDRTGCNSVQIVNHILAGYGGIQDLPDVPNDIRRIFRIAADIDPSWLIKHAAARQPFVDQSQSMNLFIPEEDSATVLANTLINGWQAGLKTLCYYCRTTSGHHASKLFVVPDCKECIA